MTQGEKTVAWMMFVAVLVGIASCTTVTIHRNNLELEKARIENETRLERTQEHLKYVPWNKGKAIE